MSGGVQLCERGLDKFFVSRLCGADKIVIRQFEFFSKRLPVVREGIAIFLRIFFLRLRRLLDFLAVFVEAGQEKNFLSETAPRARDDIGDDLFVGVAKMRLPVDVINRRGDVKPFAHVSNRQCDAQMARRQSSHSSSSSSSFSIFDDEDEHENEHDFQLRPANLQLSWLSAVAENQPVKKHRMNPELSNFATRLRGLILSGFKDADFDALALELFNLQFTHCPAYQKQCFAKRIAPESVSVLRGMTPSFARWKEIPFVTTSAFKYLEYSSIPFKKRSTVFFSSGTTEQKPSRHFHNAESLAVYETSLWIAFKQTFFADPKSANRAAKLICLTPPPVQVPYSSLVHMFETVRQITCEMDASVFFGKTDADNSWILDFDAVLKMLRESVAQNQPLLLLGTAFSFVHLLDFLAENDLKFQLPENSRVMETGGYKNRSRTMPKAELHALIAKYLGVARENIICEYGMSELSSQAYDRATNASMQTSRDAGISFAPTSAARIFHFPPWARVQIISPETNREVAEGETGLIRIFDLANVFSVAAIQTEDLGVRRGEGFELIGRAQAAEARGCSLNNAEN
jgi:hypothetical protein